MKKLLTFKFKLYILLALVALAFVLLVTYGATWLAHNWTVMPTKEYEKSLNHEAAVTNPPLSSLPVEVQVNRVGLKSEAVRADIVWKIYGLESSFGKNDDCKREGKFNGFGYGQHKTGWQCFDTFEQAVAQVHKWLESRQHLSVAQALCLYNQGKIVNDCPYYQRFLSL